MKKPTIIIANDHAGLKLKTEVIKYLKKHNFKIIDVGCFTEESVDYPDYAKQLCLNKLDHQIGVLICGTGIGMSISANRFPYIRAALCTTTEFAKLAREHNDANVLVLGARYIDFKPAIEIVDVFLNTDFLSGKHQTRIDKLK